MTYRKWDSQTKLRVVLEGLKSNGNLSELCNRYQISQTLYYQWRDKLLNQGAKVFESNKENKEVVKLKDKVKKLKGIIGDLTMELKKNEFDD